LEQATVEQFIEAGLGAVFGAGDYNDYKERVVEPS